MRYNGYEIYVLNVGKADSIFIRYWEDGYFTTILIDGGYKKDTDQVEQFLVERQAEFWFDKVDHLVSTHGHDDHISGLIELIERNPTSFANAWVLTPDDLGNPLTHSRLLRLNRCRAYHTETSMRSALNSRKELVDVCNLARIPVSAPWLGARIGPLIVLSPTAQFVNSQFSLLDTDSDVRSLESGYVSKFKARTSAAQYLQLFEANEEKPLGDFVVPENEISVILGMEFGNTIHMTTGDAGCAALYDVIGNFGKILAQLDWMQIPHHGSRRNMDPNLVKFFSPTSAFISCDGSRKHPSQKLVNAFKGIGTEVYSTAYSTETNGWLYHSVGVVPALGTGPAVSLYNKAA